MIQQLNVDLLLSKTIQFAEEGWRRRRDGKVKRERGMGNL
jgi:hypothetical protein